MSARITIPLDGAPEVIAEAVRYALRARGLEIIQYLGLAGSRALDEERVAELCREIGISAAQDLVATSITDVVVEYDDGIKPRAANRGRR